MDRGQQFKAPKSLDTGAVPLNFRVSDTDTGKVWNEGVSGMIGGPKTVMQSISRQQREEPATTEKVEYGIIGHEMHDVGSKEGRRALSGQLGLPNVKRKKRSRFGPVRKGIV